MPERRGQAQAGPESQRDDHVAPQVGQRDAQDGPLFRVREGGGGQVRHGDLGGQVPTVAAQVKAGQSSSACAQAARRSRV